ncbi:kinase-like domain-containing protein [Amylostereum chailletii]|nr:kinase-like domain-containing protein [Amylostereum chailletii]
MPDKMRLFNLFLHSGSQMEGIQLATTPVSSWATHHADWVEHTLEDLRKIMKRRTLLVNFVALKEVVESHFGLVCRSMDWVAEGGASQLYLTTLKDGRQVLARLTFPFPYAENMGPKFAYQEEYDRARLPDRLTTEIATIRFVRRNTRIPVAEVYTFDASLPNPVGTVYMVQELMPGNVLSTRWREMTIDQQSEAVVSLVRHIGDLLALPFTRFGSLVSRGSETVVGPQQLPCRAIARNHPLPDVGPWPAEEPYAFMLSLAIREKLWLESSAGPELFRTIRSESFPLEDQEKTLPAFIECLQVVVDLIRNIHTIYPLPSQVHRPSLMHGDLHFSNVLVSRENPGVITAIVDWDFSSVMPLWATYSIPGMLRDLPTLPSQRRENNSRLREVFRLAMIEACPDLKVLISPADSMTADSYNAHCILMGFLDEGCALHYSREVMQSELSSLLSCTSRTTPEGKRAAELIEAMMAHFTRL